MLASHILDILDVPPERRERRLDQRGLRVVLIELRALRDALADGFEGRGEHGARLPLGGGGRYAPFRPGLRGPMAGVVTGPSELGGWEQNIDLCR